MIWSDAVLNARADEEATRAVSVALLPSEDWTGASSLGTATLSWNAGGAAGPDPDWQPAQVGVAHAAPEVTFSGTATHFGFIDSLGTVYGVGILGQSVTFDAPTAHVFYVKTGPALKEN